MIRHSYRLAIAAALCALPVLAAPTSAGPCTAANAVYEMAEGGEARLTFEKPSEPSGYSDVNLVVTAGEPARRFAFSLTQSQGYGNNYAIAEDENVSEDGLLVFYFQRAGDRLVPYEGDIPSSDDPAPDAVFLPQLGTTLWYATNGGQDSISIPTQIWYVASCRTD